MAEIQITDEVLAAIREGVRAAFFEAFQSSFDLDGETLHDVVERGVRDAFYGCLRDASGMPGTDLFEMVKQGTREAVEGREPGN